MKRVSMLLGAMFILMFAAVPASFAETTATNERTGDDSHNKTEVKVETKVKVENQNETTITNDVGSCTVRIGGPEILAVENENSNHVDGGLNTGHNEASRNEGDGEVVTGDITFNAEIKNEVGEVCPAPCPSPTPSPTPTPTVTPAAGVGGAVTAAEEVKAGVGGAVEAGVGGLPEELPGVGADLASLLALVSGAVGSAYLRFRKK